MDQLASSPVIRVVGRPGRDDRPPLPSGHPTTWGALTAGTVLHGSPYPHPVFLGSPRRT